MGTQLRLGFVNRRTRREIAVTISCVTGKRAYRNESAALEALIRVRKDRVRQGDPRPHESHIYPCRSCEGWHLSSNPILHGNDLGPERERWPTEPIEAYARRLEKRIAEQRGQILSMLAVGHGGNNREARKRIASLTIALARVTELWDEERRNREALVEKLGRRRPRFLRRVAP